MLVHRLLPLAIVGEPGWVRIKIMGRTFDGGYAEYTVVPRSQVIPIYSGLPWETLGAIPETLQTAYGSLTTGLDLRAGQTLLIRGGTSALGLATATLAKDMGATVLATTRSPERIQALIEHGVDHALVDDRHLADEVRRIVPGGVYAALELVGTPTLPDTLAATRVHGTVCFTGMLSNQWTVPGFYPIAYLRPSGVRLAAYSGAAADLPAPSSSAPRPARPDSHTGRDNAACGTPARRTQENRPARRRT